MVKKLNLFLFLFTQLSFSQLSNFTLTVTKTDESCNANGTLSFVVNNTTPGATIIYNVYKLPNITTPIATLSTPTFSGLSAGNYTVIATQSMGTLSNTQQQNVIILNQIVPLTYQIVSENVICGNDGKITVNIGTGTAVSYELFAGPMIRPLQSSNVFSNLTTGQYSVRVFDTCGEGVVQTYTVGATVPNVLMNSIQTGFPISCNLIPVSFDLGSTNSLPFVETIAYPITVQFTVFPPSSGTQIVYNQIISTSTVAVTQQIAFYDNQQYSFNIKIIDRCGNVFSTNNNIINKTTVATAGPIYSDCLSSVIRFNQIQTIIVTAAPTTYPFAVPHNLTPTVSLNSTTVNLGLGNYTFVVTNLCGISQTFNMGISPVILTPDINTEQVCNTTNIHLRNVYSAELTTAPTAYPFVLPHNLTSLIDPITHDLRLTNVPSGFYVFRITNSCGTISNLPIQVIIQPDIAPNPIIKEGCADGFGTMYLSGNFLTVKIIAAPTNYPQVLPHNVSANINTTYNIFTIDNLPVGNYVFEIKNSCGSVYNIPIVIQGITENNTSTIIPHCGAFDINLQYASNNAPTKYWLQKYNPISGQWTHPLTGVIYTGNVNSTNSIELFNNSINYNFAYTGTFRILGVRTVYIQQNPLFYLDQCVKTIHNFTYTNQPKINDVYSFSCNNGTYDSLIDAIGVQPLIYRITQKNGQPFVVQNGNSPVFLGLTPANYNFQIEDACGNILNSPFDIPRPTPFVITPTTFCNGNNGSLSLPNFSFLQYEWWKDNNTSTILSTTNLLQFSPFNATSNTGVYHVQVKYLANPSSCINSVLDYTITGAGNSANSGIGTTTNFCGSQGNIDLFTLILGNYDIGGIWTETSSSGTLSGNIWNATGIISGNYQFKYKVTAPCGTTAESVYNVSVNSIPQTPIASINSIVCNGQSLNLLATTIANATYFWTGPNGFTANVQNPTINSVSAANDGIYTVKATVNGCDSGSSSVTVGMGLLPQFTITTACLSNKITAKASPVLSTFDPNTAIYNWTGPNGFTATGNPAILTNGKGQYYLTITNNFGCATTNPIFILYTLCEIPKGVSANNDGDNDTFDLSGFGTINNLKIFNRYGVLLNQFENYTNQWHGQDFNENKLPDGTYYYYIKLNSGEEETGWVYLTN